MADSKITDLTQQSVFAFDDLLEGVDVSDTTLAASGTNKKIDLSRFGGFLAPFLCNGRLTLESGVPVSTSDQTAKTTIYFTPYNGNRIAVYDGTRWKLYSFSELTLALGTLTSGLNYDVFVYDNAGTLTLELTAWTNDTTRATALTTQDGVYVKTGATTRRYLGTIRTTSTTTTEDSAGGTSSQTGGKRFVWNLYNRVPREASVVDTSNSWTWSTASFHQANAAAGNKVEFVLGLDTPEIVEATAVSFAFVNSGTGLQSSGVGVDSVSVNSAKLFAGNASSAGAFPGFAFYQGSPVAGYHYLAWLEKPENTNTWTWYGDAGISPLQTGLSAKLWS